MMLPKCFETGTNRCARFCSSGVRLAGHQTVVILGVSPIEHYHRLKPLFDVLSEVFPARFEARPPGGFGGLDGLILLDATREAALAAARAGVACYAVLAPAGNPIEVGDGTVQFANCAALSAVLRHQSLREMGNGVLTPIRPQAGEHVLASRAGHPLWVSRQEPGCGIHLVSLAPPALDARDFLIEHFNGERFMAMLPLLHFLQELTRELDWQPPPLRACFVFDDPSLRWPSYGYVRYPELANHADTHNYHAAIATVPLDAWWVDPRVAALFRCRPARLSLVVHGNDHTRIELARAREEADSLAILAKATRRIRALEARHDLKVCRVMEPPHGVVNCEIFDGLVALGYEAVLATTRQFLRCNRPKPCPAALGFDPAGCFPGGLAGIPRILMSPRCKTEAVLGAFLGHPIIMACHHYDAKDGLARMAEFAAALNGLGPVEWTNLTQIARTQYKTKRNHDHLVLRMGSRRVTVRIPEGVQTLSIERPWLNHGDEEKLLVTAEGGEGLQSISGRQSDRMRVRAGGRIELISPAPTTLPLADAPMPRRRIWPFFRRALAETRDRVWPYLPRSIAGRQTRNGSP